LTLIKKSRHIPKLPPTPKTKSDSETIFSRVWCMPNSNTFSIKPINDLLKRYLVPLSGGVIIDPFARNSSWGTITNDLNPKTEATHHLEATEFLDKLISEGETEADAVLLDPPYSPRQISECYKKIGRSVSATDTQNARLYKQCKDKLTKLLKPGGIAITFGWNSGGFGKTRGFKIVEILLVPHGAAHNDTIVTVEIKQ